MSKQFISQLRPGDDVQGTFAVISKQLSPYSSRSSKAGETYLKLTLRDATGTIEGRIWDEALTFNSLFDVDDIVYVEGFVSKFNGLQLVIHNLDPIPVDSVAIEDFLPSPPVDPGALWLELRALIETIENPFLTALLETVFSEKTVYGFCTSPGGRSVHHAYRGGLLHHTLEVAALAERIYEIYPDFLNRDLLVAGAILHDIGKIEEYDLHSVSFQLTDRGKLHGHLVLGRDLLLKSTASIGGFPAELEDEIGHMILSHHGCREWGSPEIPKTLEAFALFHADLTSARLTQAIDVIKSPKAANKWTNWDRLLERSFFCPNRDYDSGREKTEPDKP